MGVIEASYASAIIGVLSPVSSHCFSERQGPAAIRHSRKADTFALVTTVGPNRVLPDRPRVNLAALRTVKLLRHGSNAGHSSGVPGVDARRATPPDPRLRAGGSLAVSSPTPATPLLSPAKIRELNHAAFASLSYPTDRQVVRNPHVGRPGFLVSMSRHPRTAARPGRHAGLLLTPNCQSRSARSQHT